VIKVDRSSVAPPASLARKAKGGKHPGKTEEQAIVLEYTAYRTTTPPPEKFVFDFKAYRGDDVKAALHQLFRGKCAYCESRYAGTQPMDVEHWRPKGGVEEIGPDGRRRLIDGYPWLAARWTNLLPSCIDCNRPRTQHDAVTGEDVTLGKANQFPVAGPRMAAPDPDDQAPPAEDEALIIDPTVDDPMVHLEFRSDGTVVPIGPKGEHSIRVYALNRAELAFERLGLARLIEQRLTTIEALAAVIADDQLDTDLRYDLEDLISHEVDALLELADPGKPFSAMARRLIEENSPAGLTRTPVVAPWPRDVAERLQTFAESDARADHLIVAARLVGLGFQPHLPQSRTDAAASRSTYLRWTLTGTVRTAAIYQDATGLVIHGQRLLVFASALKGADGRLGTHSSVHLTYKQSKLDAVLVATTRLRDWADGRET
jgi:uncharacterized protein (TIGR02646 family)